MENIRHNRPFYRLVAALLLTGVLLLGAGPSALAEWCFSGSREASSACCSGELDTSSQPCAGAHFCCGKEIVASPVRLSSGESGAVPFAPADRQIAAVLPALRDRSAVAIQPARPPLLLSFAELVLQESLLSHAPPFRAV